MTKKLFALFVLALYVLPMTAFAADDPQPQTNLTPPAPLSLLFSEIASYETAEHEWIEIYNAGETEIDLTTWKFFEDETNHTIKAASEITIVAPRTLAVIANNPEAFTAAYPNYIGPLFDSTWSSLKLEGETIALKDAQGTVYDQLTYAASTGGSVERVIDEQTGVASEWIARSEGNTLGKLYSAPVLTSTDSISSSTSSTSAVASSPQPILTPPAPQSSSPIPHAIIQIQSGELEATGSTSVNFDGRASFDLNNNALTYLWDFGDGTVSDSANPGTHKFEKPGKYAVQLTVRNTLGFVSTATEEVVVHEKEITTNVTGKSDTEAHVTKTVPEKSIKITQPNSAVPAQAPMYIVAYLSLGEKPLLAMANSTPTVSSTTPSIYISELYPAPPKGGEEWIELGNKSGKKVDVSGWMLADESKTNKPYKLPTGSTIGANAFLLIKKASSKINLNNDQDSVFLADSEGGLIDQISYLNAQAEKSYVQTETGEWQWTAHTTPSKKNPPMERVTATVTKKISDAKREMRVDDVADETQILDIPESVMDAPLVDVLLAEGSRIDATVQPVSNNTYEAVRINDVQVPTKEKTPISWPLVIVIGLSALVIGWQLPNIIAGVRDWVEAEKLKSM